MSGDQVGTALSAHVVPLSGTDPDSGFDDLVPLVEPFDEADVVGLGEATHGTREFFQLKHRMVRLLVAEVGFRTVAFEATPEALWAADAYVRRGEGSPESVLGDLDAWHLQTREVGALLAWLRTFNEGLTPDERVRVRGIDLSDPSGPAEPLSEYLGEVDPKYAEAVADDLVALAEWKIPADEAARRSRLDEAEATAAIVADRLETHRREYVDASSGRRWERARHLCRVVERNCEWHRVRHQHDGPHPEGMAERDRLMAENVAWCHDRDPGAGVVVWAHNSHVQRGTFDDGQIWTGAETMGEHLGDEFGDRYCPVGFDFGRGSFRAIVRGDGVGEPRIASVGEPLQGTATDRFDALPAPCFVDLGSADERPALTEWFEDEGRIRWIGSVYQPEVESEEHYLDTDLPGSFDGLVVVGESTPARPLYET